MLLPGIERLVLGPPLLNSVEQNETRDGEAGLEEDSPVYGKLVSRRPFSFCKW